MEISLRLRNKLRKQRGNLIKQGDKCKIRGCFISIKGRNNKLIIESGVTIRNTIIEINGEGCCILIMKNTVIGERCYISCREKETMLSIGHGCMLSRGVKIMTSDGHDIYKNEMRCNNAKNIIIGSRVWLADSCTVLKGSSIAEGSVIGIGSIVTGSIPNHSIAVGNPAKVIKQQIMWDERLTY
ncbi:MAG: acyltransferase [Aeromonas sp.]